MCEKLAAVEAEGDCEHRQTNLPHPEFKKFCLAMMKHKMDTAKFVKNFANP